jgi:hypothetical protein
MVAYTRQSTLTDGDTITAALFNNEYNQLLSAFSYASSGTTGHKHDGTAGEGGHVPQIGDQDFLNKIVTDSTNNRFGIFVQVSSSAVEQIRIQDGAIVPVTDNDIDLGTSSVEFKDAYFDGTVTTDALVADTADINGGTVDGATIGASSATTGVFTTIQGSTITATTAFVPDASDGAALGTSSLEFSDLFLADGAVINFGDDQDVTLTHVADTGLLLNSTMQLQFNDSSQYINAPSATVLDINATDEIELNATLVDINANVEVSGTLTVAGAVDFGDAALSNVGAVQLDSIAGDGDTDTSITFSGSDVITIATGGTTAMTLDASQNVSIAGDLTITGDDLTMGTNTSGMLLIADGTNFNPTAVTSLSEISTVANDDVFLAIDTSGGGLKKIERSAIVSGLASSSAISNVVEDTTPQLGGDLDTNSQNILIDDAHFIADENGNEQIIFQTTSSAVNQIDVTNAATGNAPEIAATGGDSNVSLKLTPKGSGQVLIDGNVGIETGLIDLKNGGSQSAVRLYCESSNAHYAAIQAPAHADFSGNVTLTLPASTDTLAGIAATQTLTNKTLTTPVIAEIDSGSTITLDATTDIVLDADGGDIFFKDGGTTFGSATNTSGNLIIKSGTTTALTFSGANVTGAGTYTGGGTMTTGGNIVIPDAGNIGSASDTDAIAIASDGVVTFSQVPVLPDDTVATADIQDNAVTLAKMAGLARGKIIVGDASGDPSVLSAGSNGTFLKSDGTDLSFATPSVALDDVATGDAAVTLATSAGNITIDAQGNDTDIILKGTDGGADKEFLKLDGSESGEATFSGNIVIPDDGNIGSASDKDAIAISSAGDVTISQDLIVTDDVTIGDNLLLDSDGAVFKLGDDQDVTITHNADEGITLNSKDISGVSSINGGQIGGNRNYIYNGDTSVCQRATSVANIGNGDTGYHVQDRWRVHEAGTTGGEVTMSRSTEVPNGFQYSLKLDCTTAETLAADESWRLEQRLEGQDLYAWKKGTADALPVTLSFWVNATKTGTNILSLLDADNNRHISKSYTVNSSNTWEYKTVTFAGDTTGVFDRDNNASLQILFYLAAGSNFTSGTLATSWAAYDAANGVVGQVNNLDSTSNNFHITGIQLELGETASAFQYESYGQNLQKCLRYFERKDVYYYCYPGNSYATNVSIGHTIDHAQKRSNPSVTLSALGNSSNGDISVTAATGSYVSGTPSSFAVVSMPTRTMIYFGTGSGLSGATDDGISMLYGRSGAYVQLESEL